VPIVGGDRHVLGNQTNLDDLVDIEGGGVDPVDIAVKYAYVSNYSVYGAGMGPEGKDTCTPASARAAGATKASGLNAAS
jgi:hypothetical protein